MNLSFDVITKEGDKIVVSLNSFYPYITKLVGKTFPNLDIVEITIIREKGDNPIPMEAFGKIAQVLISLAQDDPDTILYYFCDMTDDLPHQRAGRILTCHEYRNKLFKQLFIRYSNGTDEHWTDVEVEMRSTQLNQNLFSHFLLRDKHLQLVDILKNEVLNNFKSISEQK